MSARIKIDNLPENVSIVGFQGARYLKNPLTDEIGLDFNIQWGNKKAGDAQERVSKYGPDFEPNPVASDFAVQRRVTNEILKSISCFKKPELDITSMLMPAFININSFSRYVAEFLSLDVKEKEILNIDPIVTKYFHYMLIIDKLVEALARSKDDEIQITPSLSVVGSGKYTLVLERDRKIVTAFSTDFPLAHSPTQSLTLPTQVLTDPYI